MKTIVNIPDYLFEHLNEIIRGSMSSMLILDYVKQGTPLPKGHGRIVDENEITSFGWNYKANHASVNAPTIIEADKGEEEMTNGEKIKELFPNAEYLECEVVMDVVFARNQENWFDLEWWNAEYQEPIKALEQEPCEDAVSRKAVINQIFYSTDNSGDVVLGSELRSRIARLPSVTPQLSSELEKNSKKLEKDFGELDCISRADSIKAMQNKAKKLKNEDAINGLCGAVAILYEMPPVTPIRPKGHWILADSQDNVDVENGNNRYICSECTFSDIHAKTTEVPYCWHCGAEMSEVEE